MAGLVPAIHVFASGIDVDARHSPGMSAGIQGEVNLR